MHLLVDDLLGSSALLRSSFVRTTLEGVSETPVFYALVCVRQLTRGHVEFFARSIRVFLGNRQHTQER
jgi:hypothetical protein